MVWSENFHFKPFPDSRAKRDRDHTQITPRTQIAVRLRLRIAPRLHPSTSLANLEARIARLRLRQLRMPSTSPRSHPRIARLRLRRLRTPSTSPRWHWDDTDRTEIAIEKWLGFDEFDRIWWIFFGWVLMNLIGYVFIYWEMVLYICLETEKMWENVRNKKKMCFLYYFQQHNQTLENIFLSWK